MFKRHRFLLILSILLIIFLSIGIDLRGAFKDDEAYRSVRLIAQALTLIEDNYLEIDKVNTKDLVYGAIEGILEKLGDPHTRFMDPDLFKEMKVETEGSFGGLGIVITIRDGRLLVISPIEETPAYKAGIKAGDWITEIEGESTEKITLFEAVKRLRGRPGTKVNITVGRKGVETPLKFEIEREVISIESVKHGVIPNGIGYLRLTTFSQNTVNELKKALADLEDKKINGLILDLRNNPGGLLEVAVPVADCFILKGVIVSIKGRDKKEQIFEAKGEDGLFKRLPLVVLINEGSASASEIVAGAIQDLKRGVILGTRSFGKGSVQTVLPLEDGSGIAITTAKYYTPSGRSIHDVGIIPDIVVEQMHLSKAEIEMFKRLSEEGIIERFAETNPTYTDKDLKELLNQIHKKGIELNEDIIKMRLDEEIRRIKGEREPLYYLDTDIQLKRAVDILVARSIFEGIKSEE